MCQAQLYASTEVTSQYYAANTLETFTQIVACSILEIAILYLILRPWSYRAASWWRAAIALCLLTPWMLVLMVMSLHASDVVFIHGLWTIAIELILIVTTVISLIGWLIQRWFKPRKMLSP